jgi:hypothetical protein
MTIQTRRFIFYSLIVIFFIAGTALIFYSAGWRLDFKTISISKLGGLFIEVAAPDVKIQVGKKVFQPITGFFKYSSLITDLFPKTYTISITKDGYQPWKKELAVQPSLITKVYPVILLPKNPKRELILKGIEDFWVGPKYTAVIKSGQLYINDLPAIGREITAWSANGNKALTFSIATKNYYLVDIPNDNTALNLSLIFRNYKNAKLLDAKFYPKDEHKLILTGTNGLYIFDTSKLSLTALTDEKFQNLFPGKLSPDKLKLASLSQEAGDKIKITFLENQEEFGKAKNEITILDTGFTEMPKNFDWDKTSSYLFIQYGDKLYFSDIDDRSAFNIQLVSKKVDKYQYQPSTDSLYVLSAGSVYKVDLK